MALNLGKTLQNVASRVVVLKFQEELEKRRQQVAATPTPQPTPAPRPVPVPGVSEATLQARVGMPQLGVPNPLPAIGGILNKIAPHRPYSATPGLDLANTPLGQTLTRPYMNAPVRPQYGLTGGAQMLAQAAQGAQAKGLAPYQAMTQTALPESVTSTPYIGRPLGLAATPATWAFGPEIGAQFVGGRAALGALGRLGWGEKGEEVLGTAGEFIAPAALPVARAGVRLAELALPEAKAAAERLYPTVREAAVGGEAGGLKLPFGKKELGPGVRVRASDRANIGTVLSHDKEADTAVVQFYNRETGAQATVTMRGSQLTPVGRRVAAETPAVGPFDPTSIAHWRERLTAELPAETGAQKVGIRKAAQAAAKAEGDEVYKSGVGKLVYSLKNWKFSRADFELAKHEELSRRATTANRIWENVALSPDEKLAQTRMAQRGGLTEGFESARLEAITAEEEAALKNVIDQHPKLTGFDKANATEALNYFIYGKGQLEPAQAGMMARIFGPDIGSAILDSRGLYRKFVDEAMVIWRLPQMFMSAGELSGTLRQAVMGESHPISLGKAFVQQLRALKSSAAAEFRYHDWMENPIVKEYAAENAFTPVGEAAAFAQMGAREEQYIARVSPQERSLIARIINRTPVISHILKGSERAYVGLLNEYYGQELVSRATQWKNLETATRSERAGSTVASRLINRIPGVDYAPGPFEVTPELKKAVVDWLSLCRGRGKLGPFEKIVPELTIPLWSPRLWAARIETVPYGIFYAIKNPVMAKMIAQDMVGFVTANTALLAMLKYSGVADVELNPLSTDWGKIKIGPMRLDPWGGFQQLARTIAQVGTGLRKASGTGEIYSVDRLDTAWRYALSKLSPSAQDVARAVGLPVPVMEDTPLTPAGIIKKIGSRTIPLWWQDIKSAWDAQGALGVGAALPGALGWGVMTYQTPFDKKRTLQDTIAREQGFKDFNEMATGDGKNGRPKGLGTPKANEITNADQRIIALQPEIDKYKAQRGGRTMSDIAAPFEIEQGTDDDAVDAGTMSRVDWLSNYKEREKNLGARYEEYLNANPDAAKRFADEAAKIKDPFALPADATPDTVRTAYFTLFDKYGGDTGVITAEDWNTLGPELDRFRAALTPAQEASLDENLGAGHSDLVKEYRAAQKTMQPYFDLTDAEWRAFTKKIPPARKYAGMTFEQYTEQVTQDLKAKGKGETWVDRDPILRLFEEYSGPKRSVFLVRNPEVDAERAMWYGTLVHTPKAARLYKEKTGLTVRIAEQ